MEAPSDSGITAEEAALWAARSGERGAEARETLFMRYAEFSRSIARRHFGEQSRGDLELGDLQQYAYSGLLEALARFDPALGVPFRAFAAHRISGCVRDGIAHTNEIREQMVWRGRVRRERLKSLAAESDSPAGPAETMRVLAEIAVGLALGFMLEDASVLAKDTGGSEPSVASIAYESLAWNEIVAQLTEEVSSLPEREQAILRQHYVIGMTFDQIAELLHVSKGRVSQLHRGALLRLRKRLAKHGHFRLDG